MGEKGWKQDGWGSWIRILLHTHNRKYRTYIAPTNSGWNIHFSVHAPTVPLKLTNSLAFFPPPFPWLQSWWLELQGPRCRWLYWSPSLTGQGLLCMCQSGSSSLWGYSRCLPAHEVGDHFMSSSQPYLLLSWWEWKLKPLPWLLRFSWVPSLLEPWWLLTPNSSPPSSWAHPQVLDAASVSLFELDCHSLQSSFLTWPPNRTPSETPDSLCCIQNACVSPKAICWNLIPKILVFRSGAVRRWLGHEGRDFMNVSALIKETLERFPVPSAMWRHSEKIAIYELESRLACQYLALELPSLQNCEKCFLFISHSVYGLLL